MKKIVFARDGERIGEVNLINVLGGAKGAKGNAGFTKPLMKFEKLLGTVTATSLDSSPQSFQ